MIEYQRKTNKQVKEEMLETLNIAMQNADKLTDQIEVLEQIKRIIDGFYSYYDDLDDLCKRLQDNINDDISFEAKEQDVNALCYTLDLLDGFTNVVTYEACPHCDSINEYIVTDNGIVKCKTCNKNILLCSVCDNERCDTCSCSKNRWCNNG